MSSIEQLRESFARDSAKPIAGGSTAPAAAERLRALQRRYEIADERNRQVEQANRDAAIRRSGREEGYEAGYRAAAVIWGLRLVSAFVIGLCVGAYAPMLIEKVGL